MFTMIHESIAANAAVPGGELPRLDFDGLRSHYRGWWATAIATRPKLWAS
ncbi:MAG: hypothetical protein ACLRRT_15605 [Ruthenibacterium lactatiformans]